MFINLKLWMAKVTQKLEKANPIIEYLTVVPPISYTTLPSQSTDNATYFREWLAYFVNQGVFSNGVNARLVVGMAWPNAQGTVIGQVYGDSPIGGLPAYCRFAYFDLSGNMAYFGTYNGSYTYRNQVS